MPSIRLINNKFKKHTLQKKLYVTTLKISQWVANIVTWQ